MPPPPSSSSSPPSSLTPTRGATSASSSGEEAQDRRPSSPAAAPSRFLLLLLCTRRGSVVEEAAAALFSFEGKPRSRGFAPKLSSSSLLFSLGRPHSEPRVPRRVLGVGHVVPHVGDALFARADLFREQGGARDGAGDEHSEHDAVLRGAERDGHGPERAFGSGFCFVSLSFLSRERRLGRRRRSRFVHGGKQ